MLSGEAANTNFIVIGLTQIELMIYHTRSEHANHYITDAVYDEYKKKKEIMYCRIENIAGNNKFWFLK